MHEQRLISWLRGIGQGERLGVQARGEERRRGRPVIVRFFNKLGYRRLLQAMQTERWSMRALPSIQAICLDEQHAQVLQEHYGDWLSCECDHGVRLQYAAAARRDGWRDGWRDGSNALTRPTQRVFDRALRAVHDVPWGVEAIRCRPVWSHTQGERVKVAIIDTGIDPMHPDLRKAFRGGINVTRSGSTFYDDNGHGTHVAGTIGAAGNGSLVGVAPGTHLYAVKAFDKHGAAYISDIIRAIEWCIFQRIEIINMSFGMLERSRALQQALMQAIAAGLTIVASAGNGGHPLAIDYPAREAQMISVSALNQDGELTSFAKVGDEVDVYAPGAEVLSTWPGGTYNMLEGSSMATAHISGILALLFQLRADLRGQTAQIRSAFADTQTRSMKMVDTVRVFQQL